MSVAAASALAIAVLMLVTWAESVRRRDASIVDPVWGPAFALVALVAALVGAGGARWLLLGLTTIWGLRLGWHLAARKRREPDEDRRYAALRRRHPADFARWSLFAIFGLQGVLVFVVALPIIAGADGGFGAATVAGVLLFAVGLGFEAVGDRQLAAFRADPANGSRVMDRGLWRYTRHPNYFGDSCVWWGLWLVAMAAGSPWWTAVGPAVMSFLLVRVSGKRLLEQDIAGRRPGYAEYVARTSGFLPLPPRARPATSARAGTD